MCNDCLLYLDGELNGGTASKWIHHVRHRGRHHSGKNAGINSRRLAPAKQEHLVTQEWEPTAFMGICNFPDLGQEALQLDDAQHLQTDWSHSISAIIQLPRDRLHRSGSRRNMCTVPWPLVAHSNAGRTSAGLKASDVTWAGMVPRRNTCVLLACGSLCTRSTVPF